MRPCTRRRALTLAGLGSLSLATGCEWFRNSLQNESAPTGGVFTPHTAPQLVGYLNDQAERISNVQYKSLSVNAQLGGDRQSFNTCSMVCEKPRNFSLSVGIMIRPNAGEVGSNDSEMWLYQSLPQENFYYCSHADLEQGKVSLPFPFDPDWVMQALGMARYDPALAYTVEADRAKGVETLSWATTAAQGQPVRRKVVFSGYPARGDKPQVTAHTISDASDKLIATASIKSVHRHPTPEPGAGADKQSVAVPTHVVLDWPSQKMRLELRMSETVVNQPIDENRRRLLFNKPRKTIEPVNLATVRGYGVARGAAPDDGGMLPPRRAGRRK